MDFELIGGIVRASGDGIMNNSTYCHNVFATFDFNNLTRAVVMAHDRGIRFGIEPSRSGMLKLFLHKRREQEDGHPALEDAIKTIRGNSNDKPGESI